jgi:hypothetical protein
LVDWFILSSSEKVSAVWICNKAKKLGGRLPQQPNDGEAARETSPSEPGDSKAADD